MDANEQALKAAELYRAGSWNEALLLISNIEKEAPAHTLALEYKGLALQKLGKFEEALECWNALISNKGEVAMYYGERGVCKFNLRFKSAIDDFNQAVELEPKNAFRYSARAYVLDKLGDIQGAIADYHRCLELDPEDAIALNNLGVSEQKLGNKSKAELLFEKADGLMGIKPGMITPQEWKRIDEQPVQTADRLSPSQKRKWIWKEVKQMLSSREGFRAFIKDLRPKNP